MPGYPAVGVVDAAEAAAAEARDERLGEPLAPATMKDDFSFCARSLRGYMVTDSRSVRTVNMCLHPRSGLLGDGGAVAEKEFTSPT